MSRHMHVLKRAGLVVDRRDTQWVRYQRSQDITSEVIAVIDAVLAAETILVRKVA